MSPNQIAFFIGLFGSVHCIGMCGPLAFAISGSNGKWWLLIIDKVFYNIGRILSYTILGYLTGLIGRQLWLSGLQQAVSIVSGLLIILAGCSRVFKLRLYNSMPFTRLFSPINRLLNYALKHRAGHLAVGMVNGFLPCGFVYLALVGAVNTAGPSTAAQYMAWFGLGTFPLMLIATISSGFIGPVLRRRINYVMPYLMVCLGFWFVLRGLALNIPYISPAQPSAGISTCH